MTVKHLNESPRKTRTPKERRSATDLLRLFWEAPMDAHFSQEVIAPVAGCATKTLECDRWRGKGIPYRKCGGRILYRKIDVINWLESHKLVSSTSESKQREGSHA